MHRTQKRLSARFSTEMNGFAGSLARPAPNTCYPTASDFRPRCQRFWRTPASRDFRRRNSCGGSSADGGGPESRERTPEGTPFNVGVWVGPDGESALAGLNPGTYGGGGYTHINKMLPAAPADTPP